MKHPTKQLIDLLREAVPEWPDAADLVDVLIRVSSVYDHLIDDDEHSKEDVHRMVRLLVYDLPLNRFFAEHRTMLLPIVMNAISAWRHADSDDFCRVKVGDIASEIGCAALLVAGGPDRLEQYGIKVRSFASEMVKANDRN